MDSSLIAPLITGSGVAGIFCVLFILGIVHSDREFKREVARGDREAARADTLAAANTEKDKALEAAGARADAAVRASELIADAFSAARGRRAGTGRAHGT